MSAKRLTRPVATRTGNVEQLTETLTSSLRRGRPSGQKPVPPYVWAVTYEVMGCRGVPRSVLVVEHCNWCLEAHVHTAGVDFSAGIRRASCGQGRYRVLTLVRRGRQVVA